MPYTNYLPAGGGGSAVFEFYENGPAVIYNSGTGDGETNRAVMPRAGTVTRFWFTNSAAGLDGDVQVELVNLTNPFGAPVTITATAGNLGQFGVISEAVAQNDHLVMRIIGLLATNAAKVTLGFELT